MMEISYKEIITEEIRRFVAEDRPTVTSAEDGDDAPAGLWQEPLVGFADVKSPYIRELRRIVHPAHQMPEDVMADARIVIVYFVPFNKWVAKTNRGFGKELASPQWAECYELTNSMFTRLNDHITEVIRSMGYEAQVASEAGIFYRDEVMSHWSVRHLAYAAGLGTFGLNNMLITEKGCSGRYSTIVTNMALEPDEPKTEEACLYKRNGSCRACMMRCPTGAISEEGFDRHKCYSQCLKNAEVYTQFGSSYTSGQEAGKYDGFAAGAPGDDDAAVNDYNAENVGSEVCGKCVVGLPCTYRTP